MKNPLKRNVTKHLICIIAICLVMKSKFMVMLNLSTYLYMIFTTERFLEEAIEIWPEWNLNPRSLNSVQTLLELSFISSFV